MRSGNPTLRESTFQDLDAFSETGMNWLEGAAAAPLLWQWRWGEPWAEAHGCDPVEKTTNGHARSRTSSSAPRALCWWAGFAGQAGGG